MMQRVSLILLVASLAFSQARPLAAEEWRGSDGSPLHWINDDEVLFVGYEAEELEKLRSGSKNQFQLSKSIVVWNSRSTSGRILAASAAGVLCFSNGIIVYDRFEEGKRVSYRGPIGSENRLAEEFQFNDGVRCTKTGGQRAIELEHGTLEFAANNTDPLKWLRRDGERVTLVGYKNYDVRTTYMTSGIRFYTFKGAYLLAEQGFYGKPSTVWWLYPEGTAEKVDMPTGPWDRPSRMVSSFTASRAGILIHLPIAGDYNLYAVRSGRASVLLKGFVTRHAISPDGCKIAYLYKAPGPKSDDTLSPIPVLRLLDVCVKAS